MKSIFAPAGSTKRLRAYRRSDQWDAVPLDLKLAILEALGEVRTPESIGVVAPLPELAIDGPTEADVIRLRDRLKAEGREHGYGTLAKQLGTSEATIRRRLGKIE